jgi:hypothetical protein
MVVRLLTPAQDKNRTVPPPFTGTLELTATLISAAAVATRYCVPGVFRITGTVAVPFTSVTEPLEFCGTVKFGSFGATTCTVGLAWRTTLPLPSTALMVTEKGVPATWGVGIPLCATGSPGNNT